MRKHLTSVPSTVSPEPTASASMPMDAGLPDGRDGRVAQDIHDARDPVPAELLAVVTLFGEALDKVSFPDVTAELLRQQADLVRSSSRDVERALTVLAAAQAARTTQLATLAQSAARGVAYARIYADAHPERRELSDGLAALAMPSSVTTAAGSGPIKRRGRPPKVRVESLFGSVGETPSAAAVPSTIAPDDDTGEHTLDA